MKYKCKIFDQDENVYYFDTVDEEGATGEGTLQKMGGTLTIGSEFSIESSDDGTFKFLDTI